MPSEGRPESIAFVGAGNMASAIIRGLIDGGYAPNCIAAADPSPRALEALRVLNVGHLSADAREVVTQAELVVLAVKPQVMAEVTANLRGVIPPTTTVMSVAAGITADELGAMLGDRELPIVRCMPNTPSLVRAGVAGLYATSTVSDLQRQRVEAVMKAVGMTLWVDNEAMLDAVIAVSGSGPAYFFAFMEAMIAKGEQLGLSHEQATELTLATAVGAARLAAEQSTPLDVLRRSVTSPGGTTEQALRTFAEGGLGQLVDAAMQACIERAQEMAEEFKAS